MLQNLTFLDTVKSKSQMENASKSCLSEAHKNHWYTEPFKT